MAQKSPPSQSMPQTAAKVLGAKGKKLHTHELNLKRLEGGKTLATHTLGDKHGRPPTDGQSAQKQFALNNPEELAAHVQGAMGPIQDDEEEGEAQ